MEADAEFFFGRQREASGIAGSLLGSRVTVVYGPSGCGKTSLLRAAVGRQLRAATGGEARIVHWRRWQGGFLSRLALVVRGTLHTKGDLLHAVRQHAENSDAPVFLLLDQFEEYFRYTPDPVRHKFAEDLARIANAPDIDVHILLALRDDALSLLDQLRVRIPHLLDTTVELRPLDASAAEQAIREPIRRWRERGMPGPATEPDRELISSLISQTDQRALRNATASTLGVTSPVTIAESGSDRSTVRVEASFLQLALHRLWEEEVREESPALRTETLNGPAIGGVAGIVEKLVRDEMAALSSRQRHYCSRMFRYLVTPTGAKHAHSVVDLQRMLSEERREDVDVMELKPPLEALAASSHRILRTQPNALRPQDGPLYELFHDALAFPVADWAQHWRAQEEHEEEIQLQHQAAERARKEQAEAERREMEARRNLRRQRNLSSVLGAVVLAMLIAGMIAWSAMRDATEREHAARLSQARYLAAAAGKDWQDRHIPRAYQIILQATGRVRAEQLSELPDVTEMMVRIFHAAASVPLEGHKGTVWSASFSGDGNRVVTASFDKTARVWDLRGERPTSVALEGHQGPVTSASFSADGTRVLTASSDGTARVWDLRGDRPTSVALEGHKDWVNSASFSADGTRVVTASRDNTARVWDLRGERPTSVALEGHKEPVTSASFSADGTRVLTASLDNTARVWDLRGERPSFVALEGHKGPLNSASFSADGTRVFTASRDGTARVWDLRGDRPTSVALEGHQGPVLSASFSADGTRVVTASFDKTARVWDLRGERPTSVALEGHQGPVTSASFSVDGTRVVTASDDRTAPVWDLRGERPTSVALEGHQGPVTSASFSADGTRVLTASLDNTARVWRQASIDDPRIARLDADELLRRRWNNQAVTVSNSDDAERPGCLSEKELIDLYLLPRPIARPASEARTAPGPGSPACPIVGLEDPEPRGYWDFWRPLARYLRRALSD